MVGQVSTPLVWDWEHEPVCVRHPEQQVLSALFAHLGEIGVSKRSIPLPDRGAESGGWILFVYQHADRAALEAELGLDCSTLTNPAQQADCREAVETVLAGNRNGSATSLGGISRLRSYALGRFEGAHSEFFGSEFRWNVSDKVKPFNIYLLRDIRTALQIAFFWEIGSVAETRGGLWKKSRSSYGVGFRLVAGSGVVYRVDLAGGQEGFQPSIFFQYPWELF